MKLLAVGTLLTVWAISVMSKMVDLKDIPNPMDNPNSCGRPITVTKSAVCDPHQLLKIDSQNEIEGYINAFTTAEVAVVIIEQMNLNSVTTVDIDIGAERYARGLHDRYGVGKKIVNNGILVFLSIKDRAIFISTGSGVQKKLTKPVLDYIIDNMKPDLRKGDYGKAISTCIISLDLALSDKGTSMIEKAYKHDEAKKSSTSGDDGDSGSGGFWVMALVFAGIFGCSALSSWRNNYRLNNTERGREKLNRIIKEMESIPEGEANKFSSQSCPICLEDFKSISLPGEKPRDIFASSEESAAEDLSKKTVSLRCGHVFCIPCMESYLKSESNNRCPICRLPIDANSSPHDHPAATTRTPRRTTTSLFNPFRRRVPAYDYDSYVPNVNANLRENTNGATSTYTTTETEYPQQPYRSRSFFDRTPEYRFRLHRLHYLYPNAMDYELLRQANTALDRGSINDVRAQLEQRGMTLQTLATDIRTRMEQAARSSGSSGSSSSGGYGGGFSSGGSGGRW